MRSALINGYEPAQLCRLSLCVSLSQSLIIGSEALISEVNVIGVVLRVVILDQKRAAWHTVIVPFASLQAAHPGELDLVEAGATRVCDAL